MSLQQKVEDLYRDWIHPQSGVWQRTQAWDAIGPAVRQALVDAAVLGGAGDRDLEAVAYALFVRTDDRLTDLGDRDIRKAAETGLVPLDEQRLEALVALGRGDRVKFGDMGTEEYRRADERHYANKRAVDNAYDEWRRAWAPYLPYLDRGLRVRDIPFDDAGGEPPLDPEDGIA